jgi:uroporphyrin-III C-methyltransferase/precorrin-2 dehydrogenase/sirohydrochlorin ferrochelatase
VVVLVAPVLGPELSARPLGQHVTHVARELAESDLDDALLLFATGDRPDEVMREIAMAHRKGVLVNVPDHAEMCSFALPAIVDRSPLQIAISSGGASPLLVRMIKERLEGAVPAAFGSLARFIGEVRQAVAQRVPDGRERRRFMERLLDGTVADLVLAGDEARARVVLAAELDVWSKSAADADQTLGEVYLVGAGPGDPDLLTFRAMRLMQRADVVVYDRLIGSPILDLVRREAERIYVGKMRNQHELPQDEISRLLVRLAKQGKRVLRLKGGDPFIFGRGGEEIELLASEGIPFQVVPGVTAAAGCASYAGIPLTHRDHAQSCIFVTGHAKNGRPDLDWATLLQPHQTVAIYMGLAMLPDLTREFLARGASPDLPVAVVDNGTRANQEVVTGTISTIAALVETAGFKGPAMTFIGTVVTLRDKLAWYRPANVSASVSAIGDPMKRRTNN